MKKIKLYSWNVNGIRAAHRKGFVKWVKKTSPDILCLQETKAEPSQLPADLLKLDGYHPYFESSKTKKGYSGVAIYSKFEPKKVVYGIGKKKFDDEGRVLQIDYGDFHLLNAYFPNGGQGNKRVPFKMDFNDEFLKVIKKQKKKTKVIFTGDVNTAHNEIDLARPKENQENTGFLPEEREWMDKMESVGFIDTFRHFYPEEKNRYTYWDYKTRARERNVGWRIDYFYVSDNMKSRLVDATIHNSVEGSDHCPISLTIKSKIK